MTAAQRSASVTSSSTVSTEHPVLAAASATSVAFASERTEPTDRNPSLAKCITVARPMPELPLW